MFDLRDGFIGVDFDDCLDHAGNIIATSLAAEWLPRLNSYSEISPSGTGVKVWVKACHDLGGKSGKRDAKRGVEVYRSRRYFTVTGRRLAQFSDNVEDRQAAVDDLYRDIFGARKSSNIKRPTTQPRTLTTLSDAEILRRASNAKNGAKFQALWTGNIEGHGSPSEADAALCSLLWFWTADREAVRRLFGQSALGHREKWTERPDYQERTLDLTCKGQAYLPPATHVYTSQSNGRDPLKAAIADVRPKVRLPGPNRILSEFADELGSLLADKDVYKRNGEVVALRDGELHTVEPAEFRTLTEKYGSFYRVKQFGENLIEFNITMTRDEAVGVLASPQFRTHLRPIRQVHDCRLPVMRPNRTVELLPAGYDAESQTLTLLAVEYHEDLSLPEAVAIINDLYCEFVFTDGERNRAVAVAGMVTMYARHMLPADTDRPCFITLANAEGAGKDLLNAMMIMPTLGKLPAGVKADDDDEMRKKLTTAVLEADPLIYLGNVKGHLNCPPLEQFITTGDWCDRRLGSNQNVNAKNQATVFIIGNGLSVSPDIRRRGLFIELFLEAETAEDRVIRRPLDRAKIGAMRPVILAALWAFVRNWRDTGRPKPTKVKGGFESWSEIIGGIVEAAGFGCPLATAAVAAVADPETDDMRRLVAAMAESKMPHTFRDLVDLARKTGCFARVVGTEAGNLDNKALATLGKLLTGWDKRMCGDWRFHLEGKGHARRYYIETLHGHTVEQGHTPDLEKNNSPEKQEETVLDLATVQPPKNSGADLRPDDDDVAAHRAHAAKAIGCKP
jgi:hypothetical protein